MSTQTHAGKIYLIGAGSGDPGLIAVRGADLLAMADVVVYDNLANPLLLDYCPQAEKIFVGKKAAQHTLTQEQINQLLVDQALAGKMVARLKGGDPFVFGRGGEECLAALAAGIEFEIVPGVTAAIAAPAYAGIPVTHRDFNSSFTFVTGHEKEEDYRDDQAKQRPQAAGSSDIDWAVLAKLPCLAFYMGVKALPRICKNLIDNGMSPAMPAATIQWGTRSQQKTVTGTLADLAAKVVAAGLGPPALTIIGQVVSLRDSLKWFEKRPLLGQTVAVTRTRDQASDLAKKLRAQGADVIETPTIETRPADDPAEIDHALQSTATYDWVIFTSVNGVSFTRKRLTELGLDARAFGTARVAAVGQSTATAIAAQLFLKVDLCPAKFIADALADELAQQGAIAGKRFLLLRADIARPLLVDRLRQAGAAAVDDVPLYHTKLVDTLNDDFLWALHDDQINWITFTSSSSAENLAKLLGDDYREQLKKVKLASIGPITSQTLAKLDLPVAVEAVEHTVDGLVSAIGEEGRLPE